MSKQHKWNNKVQACGLAVTTLLLLSPVAVEAAQAPDSGKTLQDLKRPDLDMPQKSQTDVRLEEAVRPAASDETGLKFKVNGFRITGQNVFSETELNKIVADAQGKELALADLEKLADKISDYYRSRGYIAARAYVPAQRIKDGIVEITVFTGSYDKIVIRQNDVIDGNFIKRQLGHVESGAFIEKKALEKALLHIGDLAGVEVKATLAPGDKTGTADLYLDIKERKKKFFGTITSDNFGNRFTGKNEIEAAITVLNPSKKGDQLSVSGTTSGSGLLSGGIDYKMPAGSPGASYEFGYSRMKYKLGEDFANLDANGTADVFSGAYIYNFKRTSTANLYGKIGFDHKKLYDTAYGLAVKKQSNVVTLSLDGDSIDQWGGGGANRYSLSYSAGHLDASDANSIQASTPGSFGKWNLSLARQQYINDRLSLVSIFNGQLATKNLDSSEKMPLGGAYGVRAYPCGEAAGDNAYILTNELHWTIPVKDKNNSFQLKAFYDIGSSKANKNSWTGMGENNARTLKGAGIGLNWIKTDDWSAEASYAWKIGSAQAVSDTDKSGRLWLSVTKHF